jgi:glycerol-3-phosphate dehydrogenase
MAGDTNAPYDLAIIGGGINGCGIARDAAGRGLSVFLAEQGDLAGGTSSASTKLIHGGLRYLEYYEFRLVREALHEREVLLRAAPHIIWPLRFILPHHRGLRPAWLIRLGLFLYDHLGGRRLLPGTRVVDLRREAAGQALRRDFSIGFEYSDCWVMDSRLVLLNARSAADHGATIRTRCEVVAAHRQGKNWQLHLLDRPSGREETVFARALVNAAGPWLENLAGKIDGQRRREHVRLVKGSHIIVPSLFTHPQAYIFQNADGRIVFAIPYEGDFTLIGTTDVDFFGDPGTARISPEEVDYLCRAVSAYLLRPVTPAQVVASFSGIRPLFDDGRSEAKAATRDYVLRCDGGANKAPLLTIYGGKITTYRRLAETVLRRLRPFFPGMGREWTAATALPGGDFPPEGFSALVADLRRLCPPLGPELAHRLGRSYGTLARAMVGPPAAANTCGPSFGHDLHPFEVDYLITREWARSAADILWRRSSLGLFFRSDQTAELDRYVQGKLAGAADGAH